MSDVQQKLEKLNGLFVELGSVAIAFSAGVDSTFLAAAAQRVLGNKAAAVTAYSETFPEAEQADAVKFAKEIGIQHFLLHVSELNSPEFVENTARRCYYCKKERFTVLTEWARNQGFLWVLEGSNADDSDDFRPGMQAVAELPGVRSPLFELGFTKNDIRQLSKEWGLPSWNKLSAACLSSRVSYGLAITPERLKQIESAEEYIRQFVHGQLRVRHHGDLARIEISPDQFSKLTQAAEKISAFLKGLGFKFVTLDLTGYRMGSMNAVLSEKEIGRQ